MYWVMDVAVLCTLLAVFSSCYAAKAGNTTGSTLLRESWPQNIPDGMLTDMVDTSVQNRMQGLTSPSFVSSNFFPYKYGGGFFGQGQGRRNRTGSKKPGISFGGHFNWGTGFGPGGMHTGHHIKVKPKYTPSRLNDLSGCSRWGPGSLNLQTGTNNIGYGLKNGEHNFPPGEHYGSKPNENSLGGGFQFNIVGGGYGGIQLGVGAGAQSRSGTGEQHAGPAPVVSPSA